MLSYSNQHAHLNCHTHTLSAVVPSDLLHVFVIVVGKLFQSFEPNSLFKPPEANCSYSIFHD